MSRAAIFLVPLTLAACAPSPPVAAPGPAFDAIAFFNGRSFGTAELSIVMRRPERVTVQSQGRLRPNGELVLTQRIEREGRAPTRRQWVIRRAGPTRYTGTLTDAVGPITGEATGNRLRLSFKAKGGIDTVQWLTLAPDGRSADNLLIAKRFGATVATLRERIEKTD